MAHCLGHTVLWDVFVPIFTIAWPGSFFFVFSKVDIFVAAWSITDSFCCRYSRISDGTEDSLRVTVTYMSRFGLHFLGVIASEVVLAWPPNALLGSSRMEYGQSKNPHTVHLAVSHAIRLSSSVGPSRRPSFFVGKCSRAYAAAVRCCFFQLREPLLFFLPLTPAAVAGALGATGGCS